MGLQALDPGIPDASAKLFLLPPQHLIRRVGTVTREIKGLTKDPPYCMRVHYVGISRATWKASSNMRWRPYILPEMSTVEVGGAVRNFSTSC